LLSASSPRTGRRALTGGAVALLATLAVAAPSNAATMVESSPSSAGSTSLNFSYSSGATGLNFSQPVAYERKAGG
jgi:hypothetical protein